MSKLLLLALILVAGGAIATGVLEVKVYPERAAQAPGQFVQYIASGNFFEQGRALLIGLKRKFELYAAQEDDQKMEIMLGFVRQDAARLEKLVTSDPSPQKIVPQTKMLAKSIEQAQEQGAKLSEGALAELRGPSEEAFEQAANALARVEELQRRVEEGAQDLANTLEDLDIPQDAGDAAEGEVAGAQDDTTEESESAPEENQSSIPLRF